MDERSLSPHSGGGVSRRKALAGAGSLISLSLAGCLGLRGRLSRLRSRTQLTPLWTSDRTTEYGRNHHQFAAVDALDEPTLVAPHSSLTGSEDCGISAVDATGAPAWHEPIDPDHCTPHAVGDIGVGSRGEGVEAFASTENGEVLGFDVVGGEPTLRIDVLDSIGYTAPIVGDFITPNQVIAADFEGLIVSIDRESAVSWSHDIDTQISVTPILTDLSDNGEAALAVAHGRRDESGVSVFGADGERRWTEPVDGTPRSFTQPDGAAEPVVAVGTRETAVCIEGSGRTRWTVPFGAVVSVGGSYDNRLLVGANDGVVRSVGLADGGIDWAQTLVDSDDTRLNAPVVGDPFGDGTPAIAATTYTGSVVLLDTAGEIIARYEHDDSIYVSPQFADLTGDGSDDLISMDGHGRLAAFEVGR